MSPYLSNDSLARQLCQVPAPSISFTGRLAYKVLSVDTAPLGSSDYLLVTCAPTDSYGMYGKGKLPQYENWVSEGNGADPFCDEVLADFYTMMVMGPIGHIMICVHCRYPQQLPDGSYTVLVSQE